MGGISLFVSILLVLLLLLVFANRYGSWRWGLYINSLWNTGGPIAPDPAEFRYANLEGLPGPVRRYLALVLEEGQQLVSRVQMRHSGRIKLGSGKWAWFRSKQQVSPLSREFIWDARVRFLPFLDVRVCDAFIRGRGVLSARLLGWFSVAREPGSPELDQGELLRFFAEAAWYPTAWLPSQGVVWQEMDAFNARATLKENDMELSLQVTFGPDNLIHRVYAEKRFRRAGDRQVATPWEGSLWDYELHEGMLVPAYAEVSWIIDGKREPYWRGNLEKITYQMAGERSDQKPASRQISSGVS
ncbi:DUF6544 family protein [Robiginitalea sp. SC105]|uniref:DUF6920 family protein n=1 Tax=Robiginitalea sp. SC105 TaxID=2762332 RepID=UPI0016398B74|nr:DUF6544 family protein [Robiginitalea sp. SC105]MBC2839775.1 hypothetical protein [Robiginitalea sp. SC105]